MSRSAQLVRPKFVAVLRRALRLRCPCCGRGRMYRRFYRMYHECPLCGLAFYRESGYYVGAMMINYGVTALVFMAAYLLSRMLPMWWSAPVNEKIFAWMGAAVVFSLALVPHSRSMWLAVDYWIEPWPPAEPQFRSP
jgi:uncharacterized protein (DUF983 family)